MLSMHPPISRNPDSLHFSFGHERENIVWTQVSFAKISKWLKDNSRISDRSSLQVVAILFATWERLALIKAQFCTIYFSNMYKIYLVQGQVGSS